MVVLTKNSRCELAILSLIFENIVEYRDVFDFELILILFGHIQAPFTKLLWSHGQTFSAFILIQATLTVQTDLTRNFFRLSYLTSDSSIMTDSVDDFFAKKKKKTKTKNKNKLTTANDLFKECCEFFESLLF